MENSVGDDLFYNPGYNLSAFYFANFTVNSLQIELKLPNTVCEKGGHNLVRGAKDDHRLGGAKASNRLNGSNVRLARTFIKILE